MCHDVCRVLVRQLDTIVHEQRFSLVDFSKNPCRALHSYSSCFAALRCSSAVKHEQQARQPEVVLAAFSLPLLPVAHVQSLLSLGLHRVCWQMLPCHANFGSAVLPFKRVLRPHQKNCGEHLCECQSSAQWQFV